MERVHMKNLVILSKDENRQEAIRMANMVASNKEIEAYAERNCISFDEAVAQINRAIAI